MRIVVTGAEGQLGRLFQEGTRLSRRELDVTDRDAVREVLSRLKPDVVVNAAAYTAVDKAESEKERAFAVNAEGPANLAAACRALGARLIHFSTDYVFDGTKSGAYLETDPTNPINVYGASKREGELAVAAGLENHVILRVSWLFSAHGANFPNTMRRLAKERTQLKVVGDQRGCPTAAEDLVQTVSELLQTDSRGLYHCCNQPPVSWYEFARAVLEGSPCEVLSIPSSEYPTPAKRPANSVMDCSKLEAVLGRKMGPWLPYVRAADQTGSPSGSPVAG